MATTRQTAEARKSESLETRLRAVLDVVEAQQRAIAELTDATERNADTIGGLILALRALMDIMLDEEQRAMLESHLRMMIAKDERDAKRSMIDTLFD